jgi:hypothetical protein
VLLPLMFRSAPVKWPLNGMPSPLMVIGSSSMSDRTWRAAA